MDSGQIVRSEVVDHQNAVPDFQRLYVGQAEPHCPRINGSLISRCPDMPPPQNRAAAQSRRRCVAASTPDSPGRFMVGGAHRDSRAATRRRNH
jgi:hypothetical protein